MTRARAVITGLAALVLLVAIAGGLPVVLYRFGGSPLPGSLPGWHHLAGLLAASDNGSTELAVIRDCAWLAWLLFTACILAESHAALRNRRAPRLRLGGIQGAAAHLVALAALAFSTPTAVTLSASAAVMTGQLHPGAQPPGEPQVVVLDSMATPDSRPASSVVVVQTGDCLWSIAQRYLGAGDLYPEIARLNYGREMDDGGVFTNPSLIRPGWQLVLPSAALVNGSAPAIRPGEASQHSGHSTRDAHYQRRHPPARALTVTDGVAHPEPATAPAGHRASAVAEPPGEHVPEPAVFMTGALTGAVLTSLTRLRFRQRQARGRGRRIRLPADPSVRAAEQRLRAAPPGEPVQTLPEALACLEAGLLAAGQDCPDIVGLHLTPEVLEVLLAAPALAAPPPPYEVTPGRQGMCWHLGLPAFAASSARTAGRFSRLLPGLATIGATADGYLLLNLESLQVTGVDGPADLVDRVIATIATELATGQWSGWYDLILVGCDELASLGRAEHCATLDEALSALEPRCARAARRLAARGPVDVRELRIAEPDDEDWALSVLISRAEATPDQLTRLLDIAVDGSGGIGVVLAGDVEAADGRMAPAVLQLAPDPQGHQGIVANVVPLQVTVHPRVLSQAEYDAIGTLFTVAADLGDVAADEQPYAFYGAPPWIPQATGPGVDVAAEPTVSPWPAEPGEGELAEEQSAPEPDYRPGADLPGREATPAYRAVARAQHPEENLPGSRPAQRLEVRILGPFAITGSAEHLLPKQAELVLALALAAPAGLSNSALCTMLGADPDHPKPSDAVRQIITRTRRRLGLASDGQEYIVHAGNGHYLLHPEVTLDWTRFREFAAAGQADDLRSALALICGQPFAGSYSWWIDIPLVETVRAEIVDTAETLAEFELATGSARGAARAARSGLMADAAAEQLWRVLMRAEHAVGNLAGVAEAWRRCLDAIEDVAPGGEPHPDTAALYRGLMASAAGNARVR